MSPPSPRRPPDVVFTHVSSGPSSTTARAAASKLWVANVLGSSVPPLPLVHRCRCSKPPLLLMQSRRCPWSIIAASSLATSPPLLRLHLWKMDWILQTLLYLHPLQKAALADPSLPQQICNPHGPCSLPPFTTEGDACRPLSPTAPSSHSPESLSTDAASPPPLFGGYMILGFLGPWSWVTCLGLLVLGFLPGPIGYWAAGLFLGLSLADIWLFLLLSLNLASSACLRYLLACGKSNRLYANIGL